MKGASGTDRPKGPSDGETPHEGHFLDRSRADREIDRRGSSEHTPEFTIQADIRHLFESGEPVPLARIAVWQGGPRRDWGYSFGIRDGYMSVVILGPDTEVRTVFNPHLVRELPEGVQTTIDQKAQAAEYNEKRYFLDRIAVLPAAKGRSPIVVKYYGPSTWAADSTLVREYYYGGGTRSIAESARYFPGQTGVNVLIVTKGNEYVISDCPPTKKGLPPHSVGVLSEGLSRSEDSRPEDGAPDLRHCALRAVSQELGILESSVINLEHIGMGTTRAGICDDLWIARTNLTIDQIRELHNEAQEGSEHLRLHAVKSDPESLMRFFMTRNADREFPIPTSPAQAVLYAGVRREHGEQGIRDIESLMTEKHKQAVQEQLESTGHW